MSPFASLSGVRRYCGKSNCTGTHLSLSKQKWKTKKKKDKSNKTRYFCDISTKTQKATVKIENFLSSVKVKPLQTARLQSENNCKQKTCWLLSFFVNLSKYLLTDKHHIVTHFLELIFPSSIFCKSFEKLVQRE